MDRLINYFNRHLPQVEVRPLVEAFDQSRQLKKGELLIGPDMNATFLAFIRQGAFRVYFYNEKGNEITTWFSFEGMFVTDLLSFYQETPAKFYVEAIERSEVYMVQKERLESLYHEYPAYREFGRKFAERGMVLLMERMLALQTKSAEERYKELWEQPQFMQKIPLKYLATYLGITDSSLSRIRKNLSQ